MPHAAETAVSHTHGIMNNRSMDLSHVAAAPIPATARPMGGIKAGNGLLKWDGAGATILIGGFGLIV